MMWLFPKKAKEDQSVKELTEGIAKQTGKLQKAITNLDSEVASMKKERQEMDAMLDEAVSLVSRKRK